LLEENFSFTYAAYALWKLVYNKKVELESAKQKLVWVHFLLN